MELLSDEVYRLRLELEDAMMHYLGAPYTYPQEIVDEVIDIIDRMESLAMKMNNPEFAGSFRFRH